MSRVLFSIPDGDSDDTWIVEWSSVCDAPTRAWLHKASDPEGDRISRALRNGHSYIDREPEPAYEHITFNRAGKNETCLTIEQMVDWFNRGGDPPVGFDGLNASEAAGNGWCSEQIERYKSRGNVWMNRA